MDIGWEPGKDGFVVADVTYEGLDPHGASATGSINVSEPYSHPCSRCARHAAHPPMSCATTSGIERLRWCSSARNSRPWIAGQTSCFEVHLGAAITQEIIMEHPPVLGQVRRNTAPD